MLNNTIQKTINVISSLVNKTQNINQITNTLLSNQDYSDLNTRLSSISSLLSTQQDNKPYFQIANSPDPDYNGNYYYTGITITDIDNNLIWDLYSSNNNKYIGFELQMYSYVVADNFNENNTFKFSNVKYYIANNVIENTRFLQDPSNSQETSVTISVINAQYIGTYIHHYIVSNSTNNLINNTYTITSQLNSENQPLYKNPNNYTISFYPSLQVWKLEFNNSLIGMSNNNIIITKYFNDMIGDDSGRIYVDVFE